MGSFFAWPSRNTLRILYPLIFAIFLYWMIGVLQAQNPDIFVLHLNPFAWLSAIALLGNIFVLLKISTFKIKDATVFTFSGVVSALTIWSATELLQRLSSHPEGYIFWDGIQSWGWVTLPVTFLLFTIAYSRVKVDVRSISMLLFLVFSSLFFLYLGMGTGYIDSHSVADYFATPWGYDTNVHPLLGPFVVW